MTHALSHTGAQVQKWQLFAYGQVGLPLAALSLPLYVYLPSFYADTLGLGLATVGFVLLAARIWDFVTDPVIGILSDRLGRQRNRRKKWIASGAPLLLVGILFLFLPVDGADATYLLLASFVFYLGATMVMLPYVAWGAELSGDYHDRSRVTGAREAFVILGTVVTVGIPAIFSNDIRTSLQILGVGTAILLVPSIVALLTLTPDRHITSEPNWHWREAAQTVYRNKPFRRLLAAYLLNGFANGLPATLFVFFVGYRLAAPEATGGLLMLYFLCGIVGIPLWLWVSRRSNKHRAWSIAMIVACVSFLAVPFLESGDVAVFAVICIVSGFCLGADLSLPPSMQADIVARDTADTGAERAGLFFGLWNLATKLSLALAVGMAFPLLEWSGFETDGEKTASRLLMLSILYGGLPIVLKLSAIALIWRHHASGAEIDIEINIAEETIVQATELGTAKSRI